MPDSAEVSDTLGVAYMKKGLLPSAINAFETAVRNDPKEPSYQYRLGLAYAKAGNVPQARRVLEAALRLDPKSSYAAEARTALESLH